ncbi:MAG TPA: hypothetical protein VF529_06870 [Solirubrobacteraceae bacterium]|jgi:hypothetical protein
MTDDVEETLASLEQRLRALQAELDAEAEAAPPLEPRRFPRADAPPPRPDPLEAFGAELRRLVDVWDQTVAALRRGGGEAMVFAGAVALEARGDLPQLCALERALRGIDGVATVNLRAYAGGAAAIEVALDREVALVAELRRSLAFDLIAVGDGRLTISLG